MYDINRDYVASFVHLSSSYFSMIFKQICGKHFSDYLTEVRIKKAILLLEKGENPAKIYKKVGYNANRYFINNFKKITLYTPEEYQQIILRKEE